MTFTLMFAVNGDKRAVNEEEFRPKIGVVTVCTDALGKVHDDRHLMVS